MGSRIDAAAFFFSLLISMSLSRVLLALLFLLVLPPISSGASSTAGAWEYAGSGLRGGNPAPDTAIASAPIQVVHVVDGRKRQAGSSSDSRPPSSTLPPASELPVRLLGVSFADDQVRPFAERLPYHANAPPAER